MIRSPDPRGKEAAPRRRCRRSILLGVPLLLALLLLATCGLAGFPQLHFAAVARPPLAPPAAAPTLAPYFTDADFVAEDGARLPLRKWVPAGPVKAVILALHGFGDYSHAFAMPAKRWAARGIATYAYDQRGFGRAPGHGLWPGEGRLALDAIEASRALRRAYPGRPLYLLGESMGGAVVVLAMTGAMRGVIAGADGVPRADADGVILSAPAVWGRATMDLLQKLALFAAVRIMPENVLSGRGLRIRASDNNPMLRALARDPLVLKGARVDTIFGLVDLMDDALDAAPRLDMPLLLLYGAHDEVVPAPALAAFATHLPPVPPGQRRLAYYPQGWHLLLRDLDGATVADDVAAWVFDPNAPLPSRADRAEDARPWPPDAVGER